VGALVASAAIALYAIAHGVKQARRLLRLDPRVLIALGLLTTLISGVFALVAGRPFLTGVWSHAGVPVVGKLGTPLLFDAGVYLVVVGVTLKIVFSLAED
jgi:multicomponent Na+:H+ antiporter subunit B